MQFELSIEAIVPLLKKIFPILYLKNYFNFYVFCFRYQKYPMGDGQSLRHEQEQIIKIYLNLFFKFPVQKLLISNS